MADTKDSCIADVILKNLSGYISGNESIVKEGGRDFSKVEFFGRILLLKVFQDMGVFLKKGESYLLADLKSKFSIIPKYEQFFNVLLSILEKEGFLSIKDGNITTLEKVESEELKKNIENLSNFKNDLISNFPDMSSHFNLLEICLSNYKDILNGTKDANEVLFPLFSLDLVKGIFVENKMADYFNMVIAKSIINYIDIIKSKGVNDKIKILELGAGTGGTAIFVLDALKEYSSDVEFYYTDISRVFVKKGQKRFSEEYPFAIFKKMDIESDSELQGFLPSSFDIIYASNVVHATKDIKNTTSNIHKLLKSDGLFLLNEVTNSQDFVNLTFGLMDGWWLFEDKELRLPQTPLLHIDMWLNILGQIGFASSSLATTSHQDIKDSFSQSLFIAQKLKK